MEATKATQILALKGEVYDYIAEIEQAQAFIKEKQGLIQKANAEIAKLLQENNSIAAEDTTKQV